MHKTIAMLATLALLTALPGCSGYGASNSSTSGSGITVFGEIDAAITHSR